MQIYGGPNATADSSTGPNEVYSHFYSVIQNETWTANSGSLVDNLKGITVPVPAGETVQRTIVTDPDHRYLIKSFRFSVYAIDEQNSVYQWYDQPAGWYYNFGDYQTAYGTALTRKINVSISTTPDARYLRGGSNTDFLASNSDGLRPLQFSLHQGYDYGFGQVRQEHYVPINGTIQFEFTNTHDVTLYVAGCTYGYKIREIAA